MTDQPTPPIPRWRLLQKSPMDRGDGYLHMFEAGTIFESRALPGVHWEPLNESAVAAMNDWLAEKVEVLDKDFAPTGKYISRRQILGMPNSPIRLADTQGVVTEAPESRIVAVPNAKKSSGMELAAARFSQATPYQIPAAKAPDSYEGEGDVRFVEVAPVEAKLSTVTGKPLPPVQRT